jgi:hypothetical protein
MQMLFIARTAELNAVMIDPPFLDSLPIQVGFYSVKSQDNAEPHFSAVHSFVSLGDFV